MEPPCCPPTVPAYLGSPDLASPRSRSPVPPDSPPRLHRVAVPPARRQSPNPPVDMCVMRQGRLGEQTIAQVAALSQAVVARAASLPVPPAPELPLLEPSAFMWDRLKEVWAAYAPGGGGQAMAAATAAAWRTAYPLGFDDAGCGGYLAASQERRAAGGGSHVVLRRLPADADPRYVCLISPDAVQGGVVRVVVEPLLTTLSMNALSPSPGLDSTVLVTATRDAAAVEAGGRVKWTPLRMAVARDWLGRWLAQHGQQLE